MATKDSIDDVYVYWLEPDDLQGREHELVIVDAFLHVFYRKDNGKQLSFDKVCLRFKGAKRAMYLDARQAKKVEKITGTDKYKQWVGKTITIAPAQGRIEIYSKPLVKGAPKVAAPSVARNQLVEA